MNGEHGQIYKKIGNLEVKVEGINQKLDDLVDLHEKGCPSLNQLKGQMNIITLILAGSVAGVMGLVFHVIGG